MDNITKVKKRLEVATLVASSKVYSDMITHKLTAEKVMLVLRKKGVNVSIDQASSILKFLRMCASIVVENHFKSIQQKNQGGQSPIEGTTSAFGIDQ